MHSITSLRTLYANIGKLITASLKVEDVLNGLMEEIRLFFNPENWSLLRLDPASNELFFMVIQGIDPKAVEHIRLSLGEGIAGTVAQTGEPIFIQDTAESELFSKKVDEATGFTTRSVIAVPMVFRDKIYGVIELINTLDQRGFSNDDFFVLTTIADYAAIALANAVAYEEALQRAQTDPLTGLYNRLAMDKILEEWTREENRARREGDTDTCIIAILLDLDNFKILNDTLGHKAGDAVLKSVAKGLRASLRDSDYIFRIGGDEFLALLRIRSCDRIDRIKKRLETKLADIWLPYTDRTAPPVALSIGIESGPVREAHRIIHEADLRMYQCKKERKSRGIQ